MSDEKVLNTNSESVNKKELTKLFEENLVNNDFARVSASLLALPDDKFTVLAPIVLDDFNKAINNPSERVMMMSSIRAQGITVEEYIEAFQKVSNVIQQMPELSDIKKNFLSQILAGTVNMVSETEGISKRFIQVPIEFCDPRAKMPEYAHLSDSGADVFAIEDVTIAPGETKLIRTGLKAAIPPGYELQIRAKSGRSLKTKLRLANSVGTIDAGFRDEICIIMENVEPPFKDIDYDFNDDGSIHINSILHGQSYTISAGEKVAQLVLSEVPKAGFYEVKSVLAVEDIDEDRGGGFGSSSIYSKEDPRYASDLSPRSK